MRNFDNRGETLLKIVYKGQFILYSYNFIANLTVLHGHGGLWIEGDDPVTLDTARQLMDNQASQIRSASCETTQIDTEKMYGMTGNTSGSTADTKIENSEKAGSNGTMSRNITMETIEMEKPMSTAENADDETDGSPANSPVKVRSYPLWNMLHI